MKALTELQGVRARDWLKAGGYTWAWDHTAAQLAKRLNLEDCTDCYTKDHMEARRRQVWPKQQKRVDPVKDLQAVVQKLTRRVDELERTLERMKQGRLPLAG